MKSRGHTDFPRNPTEARPRNWRAVGRIQFQWFDPKSCTDLMPSGHVHGEDVFNAEFDFSLRCKDILQQLYNFNQFEEEIAPLSFQIQSPCSSRA